MNPRIGIITIIDTNNPAAERASVSMDYITSVIKAEGIPLLLPYTTEDSLLEQYIDCCDGFLFSGGIDISPCKYGAAPSPLLGSTSLRQDDYQLNLMKKVMTSGKPFLAICRGIQVLNVACGGTLYQDSSEVPGTIMKHMQDTDRGDISHEVTIVPGTKLASMFGGKVWTNSYHHQSVRELGKGLKISARAGDGVVEAVELEHYGYGMGIQWHPEVMFRVSNSMRPLFESLVNASSSQDSARGSL